MEHKAERGGTKEGSILVLCEVKNDVTGAECVTQ